MKEEIKEILSKMIEKDDSARDNVIYDVGKVIGETANKIMKVYNKYQEEIINLNKIKEENFTEFIKHEEINKRKKEEYFSVNECFKRINMRERKYPVRTYIYRLFWRCIRLPGEIRRNIVHFIQRGKRGFSDRDVWNFSFFLSDIIEKGLKQLKENGMGLPTWSNRKTELQAIQEWDNILNHIIYTFTTAKEIAEGNVFYINSKKWTKENYYKMKKFCDDKKYSDFRPMTLKETKEYEKGFEIFKNWFHSLWD